MILGLTCLTEQKWVDVKGKTLVCLEKKVMFTRTVQTQKEVSDDMMMETD